MAAVLATKQEAGTRADEVAPTAQPPSLVPLPLLDAAAYEPSTFDYEASGIDEAENGGVCLREWIDVFRHSTSTFAAHIAESSHEEPDAEKRAQLAARFSREFPAALDAVLEARRAGKTPSGLGTDPTTGRVTCISLCHLRDSVLFRLGFRDIFLGVKRREDGAALALLPGVLRGLDAVASARERLELAVRGVLAGNVFDLGAAASAQLFARGEGGGAEAFSRTRDERLLPRPWAVDDLDALLDALLAGGSGDPEQQQQQHQQQHEPQQPPKQTPLPPPYKKAVLFADNAGSDVLLGLVPLARELLRLGVPSVVLAANTHPTLNDTTAAELAPLLASAAERDPDPALLPRALASGALRVVASGNELPVIDLRRCSRELAAEFDVDEGMEEEQKEEEEDEDKGGKTKKQSGSSSGVLLVLEGMGRGIETNLNARFTCDALRIGVIKHPEVARCLGGRLYDPVVKFAPA